VQPRVLLRSEIVTRTVFVASDSQGTVAVRKVEQTEPAGSLSEQTFYAGLATIDPVFPANVRSLLTRLTDLGCETQLLRKYNVYLDDGLGGRLNVLSIASAGTVEVWGTSVRDAQLGEPAGHTYMNRVAAILPGGRVKDDSPNPGSWNIRVDGKVAIDPSFPTRPPRRMVGRYPPSCATGSRSFRTSATADEPIGDSRRQDRHYRHPPIKAH